MALVTLGPLVGQVSGRLGATIFSHNKGGPYVRNGSIPTNPNTTYQQNIRANLANRSQEWAGLTDTQRMAWGAWAVENPVRNRLGKAVQLSGQQSYIQLNHRLQQSGSTLITDPPVEAPPVPLATLTGSFDIGAGDFEAAYTATPAPAGVMVALQVAVVSGPGISYIENLLKLVGFTAAAAASPYDCEAAVEARFGTLQVGQKVVMRACTFDTDTGLYSLPLQDEGIIVST